MLKIAPATEADPAAILASALAFFGAMAGDAAHVRIGQTKHPARIWPLIIGKTGAGRKGTSWAEARHLGAEWGTYAAGYSQARVQFGLTSGEGLLGQLGGGQDRTEKPDAPQPIAPDGRLTVVETEFARVLSSAKRDGSTLGPVLRQLWDDGEAGIMRAQSPLRISGAHVTMVAHVTPKELRLRLAESDLAGGTLNRFLLIASERPHLLPHEIDRGDVAAQCEWLGRALDRARLNGALVKRSRAAEDLWPAVYRALSEDEPDGQLGSVLARGPAYTMRLALVYALVDGAGSIEPRHLLSALAVWQYAADTARDVFPEGRVADDLQRLAAFLTDAPQGRTNREITDLFNRNLRTDDIAKLMAKLERFGEVKRIAEPRIGPGRPAYRYYWHGQLSAGGVWELLCGYEETN